MRTLIWLVLVLLPACSSPPTKQSRRSVDLIRNHAGATWVVINTREWGGVFGVDGFVGFENQTYLAKLEGSGPVYTAPFFQDNPFGVKCVGTITLDRKSNKVLVDMHRVVTDPRESVRSGPHPANGFYTIGTEREAKPTEKWYQ